MTNKAETAGPYIVWENYGCEGWQPKSYPTLKEALCAQRYNSEFVITTLTSFDVVEQSDTLAPIPASTPTRRKDWHYDSQGYCDNPGRGY